MSGGSGHPAGWYDDGVTPGVQRWFDGVGWSETTRPLAPVPVAAPAAQVAAYGQPVGFGVPTGFAGQPAFGQPAFGQPAFGQPVGFGGSSAPYGAGLPGQLVDESAIRSARRATIWSLAGAIVALVLGGVLALARAHALRLGLGSGGSSYITTGGLIGGTLAFVRGARSYRVMVGQGGEPWSGTRKSVVIAAAAMAALLAVVGVVQAARASSLPPIGPAVAGSCWTGEASEVTVQLLQVRCETEHAYVGTLVVRDATGAECPADTHSVLDLADGTGYYLCIATVPTPGT